MANKHSMDKLLDKIYKQPTYLHSVIKLIKYEFDLLIKNHSSDTNYLYLIKNYFTYLTKKQKEISNYVDIVANNTEKNDFLFYTLFENINDSIVMKSFAELFDCKLMVKHIDIYLKYKAF